MRKSLKKLCCAILCTCLLIINTQGSVSYAGNLEQYATDTDAAYADVPEADGTARTATAGDAADIDASSATAGDVKDIDTSAVTATDVLLYATATVGDALLYATPPDVSEGGYSIEINSQADWDILISHTAIDGSDSGWIAVGIIGVQYIENKNPVVIILNADISLSHDTILKCPTIDSVAKDFLLYGNGHSIEMNTYQLELQANTVAIDNVHIKNGRVKVAQHNRFVCTDSQFSAASVDLYAIGITERTYITGCKFFDCTSPCVKSNAPTPISFSDCYMDNCGCLFDTSLTNQRVSFFGITAENCTGTVLGGNGYIIDAISDCKLSTQTPGITAIEHEHMAVGEITGCTITGFDTGIKLFGWNANWAPDIDTITISDSTITDCITGVDIGSLSGYENAIISNLTIEAREGASGTVGYKGDGSLTTKTFYSVNYDFNQMPQIKSCHISGFDTGILLNLCQAVISDCEISDCMEGINISSNTVAIVDTTLTGKGSAAYSTGVTTNNICFLIDCDINDFNVGSNMHASGNTTIIGCRYQNRDTNLICAFQTAVYDTSFIGGETSVISRSGTSYFYDCVVEGDAATQSGISMEVSATNLHIYNLDRPYSVPINGYYDSIQQYSDRNVNNGKSEIFNCETGIDAKSTIYVADTHIHDCGTGMKSNTTYSYGNNLIEDCRDGMIVTSLFKYKTESHGAVEFTDIHTDTIRGCSNDGINNYYITSNPVEWNNRLEVYDCGNYGIQITGNLTSATVDVHDCKTGIYTTDTSGTIVLGTESKVYDNLEWNVYYSSTNSYGTVIIQGGTLTGGAVGNVYSEHQAVVNVRDLYSDDSVYYLGTEDVMFIFSVDTLYGTAVLDTVDSGYTLGRRVAGLSNPDIVSQMFAKKEGFVISTEQDGSTTYAVFAAGSDVAYDVTANGGDTFNDEKLSDGVLTKISYLNGASVDLTYTASKTGYEFVGWNTDKNATEGLTALTAETKDITLYAIYKKTAYISYHTYDAASDYRTAVTFYNNQDEIECSLAAYNAGGDNTFAGYVLDEEAVISSADDILAEGDNVIVSPDGLDVYCVYEKQGQLDYLKKDGTILSTERITVYETGSNNKKFLYTVQAGEPVAGFTFTGWKDKDGKSYIAGNTISTEDGHIVLTPVYVVYEEPTEETPTTENPTEETPTTENPTEEPPIIQPPTTETPTTEAQAGPKTGDSTAPIGVIGLAILSLLSLLVLSMKNKRKN